MDELRLSPTRRNMLHRLDCEPFVNTLDMQGPEKMAAKWLWDNGLASAWDRADGAGQRIYTITDEGCDWLDVDETRRTWYG